MVLTLGHLEAEGAVEVEGVVQAAVEVEGGVQCVGEVQGEV